MNIKVIILAAGFGTRMKKYTQDIPKPLLPIKGKPLLEYTLLHLNSQGFTKIGINTHYRSEKITAFLQGFLSQTKMEINTIYEPEPSGTAGAVARFKDFLNNAENFIVIYGDILTDLNYKNLLDSHTASKKIATICVHLRDNSNSFIDFDENKTITSFIERPTENEKKKFCSPYWVNSGIYCFKKEILKFIPDNEFLDFPKDIFPKLLRINELSAYPIKEKRIAIDDEAKYIAASKEIDNFNFIS